MKFRLRPLVFKNTSDGKLYASVIGQTSVWIKPNLTPGGLDLFYWIGDGPVKVATDLEHAKWGCERLSEQAVLSSGLFDEVKEYA